MTQVLDPTLDDSTASVAPDPAYVQAPETPPVPSRWTSGQNGARGQLGMRAPASALVSPQAVSGRYQATTATWQVDLRVDVDGSRTTRRVSGDLFSMSGAT